MGGGGRFKREETYVYLWLIHAVVRQKPIQHCKAIILQIKKKKKEVQETGQQRGMEKSEGMFGGEGRASYVEAGPGCRTSSGWPPEAASDSPCSLTSALV